MNETESYWKEVTNMDVLVFGTVLVGFVSFLWLAKIWPF